MGKKGRPTVLERLNITVQDLEDTYQELITYQAVADHYGISLRTVKKYLSAGRKRGRHEDRKVKVLFEKDPLIITRYRTIKKLSRQEKIPYRTVLRVVNQRKSLIEDELRLYLKRYISKTLYIQDVRGRKIPTAAIRYVWVPKWKWEKPIFVRVILKDRTRAKLPTFFTPHIDGTKECLDF